MSTRIRLCQFNPVNGNPEYNAARMLQQLDAAAGQGVTCVLFGELSLTGYYQQDLYFNDDLQCRAELALDRLCREADRLNIGFVIGLSRLNTAKAGGKKHLYNSICFYQPGQKPVFQNKVLLPSYGEFDETRWFQSADLKGIQLHQIGSEWVGFIICEDGWNNPMGVPDARYRLYAEDPIEQVITLARNKKVPLSAIINISASPDYVGKQQLRLTMYQSVARHYQVPIIFHNCVMAQDELVFGGRSFVLDKVGKQVWEGPMCTEGYGDLDLTEMKMNTSSRKPSKHLEPLAELDALIGLYLNDYLRKSKSGLKAESGKEIPRLILGLSGGKDSACVASVLARHLGAANVLGVLMPYRVGEYTHNDSLRLAESLARCAGIEFRVEAIDAYVDPLATQLKMSPASLAHQNLQARIRANILWGIANQVGGMVVNTTNFSEAAMGYGTIGGDLLGLPLIASLPATLVVEYLHWLRAQGCDWLSEEMINREPTAELAPGQFDAHELGAYSYIDPIIESLRMNFGDVHRVLEQFQQKKHEYCLYNATTKAREQFVERLRFLARKLLVETEYKRQYYNRTPQFTPYTWLRWKWPVANGFMDVDGMITTAVNDLKFI